MNLLVSILFVAEIRLKPKKIHHAENALPTIPAELVLYSLHEEELMEKNKSLLQRLKDERWLQLMALAGLIWMLVFNYAPMYDGRKWAGLHGQQNHQKNEQRVFVLGRFASQCSFTGEETSAP